MKILVHVSNKNNLKVLKPKIIGGEGKPYVCFSLNEFCSHFGQYIYLFDLDTLVDHYKVVKILNPQKMKVGMGVPNKDSFAESPEFVSFEANDKLSEYRIPEPVNCAYCLGIIKHYNETVSHFTPEVERKIKLLIK